MKKTKNYPNVYFTPEIILEAEGVLISFVEEKNRKPYSFQRKIELTNGEGWDHDLDEEFFADYRKPFYGVFYYTTWKGFSFDFDIYSQTTHVSITAPERRQIEAVFEIFERNVDKCKLPPAPEKPKPKPVIFIGHGRNEQWKNLKDHLHEKHGYEVEAYEIGARAGHEIRDILEEMLNRTSFAILVMTGEDKTEKGEILPRLNVVHELGLFQGKLGFPKAIVLLEEDTEVFSNIHGTHQIRYGKGNIKETFGEVLATLRREFGNR